MQVRNCPTCVVPMQGMRREEIELERCDQCGGVWFDRGELEQVSAKRMRPLRIQPSQARCVACDGPLMEVRIGLLRGASCSRCEGTFIEGASMAQLPPSGAALASQPRTAQVRCRGCARYLPIAQAISTRAGPSCSRCAPTGLEASGLATSSGEASVGPLDAVEAVLELIVEAIDFDVF